MSSDSQLHRVLQELEAREPIFHRPELGTSRADFESMTMPDFWEVGASGKRYSRQVVLDELDRRYSNPYEDVWGTSNFAVQELAPDLYLLTYRLIQDKVRLTHRSTIWRETAEGWKIVFHQGTVISQPS